MCASGRPITLLLCCLLGSATSSPVSSFTPAPPLPSQVFPPSPSQTVLPSPPSPALGHSEMTGEVGCPLTMSPSSLVVRFGDPVTANCSVSRTGFSALGWVVSLAAPEPTMDRFSVWHVDRMTDWSVEPKCYALSELGGQCDIDLALIVYKPPGNVSISFGGPTGPMFEGLQYTLQCTVEEVAPVGNLTVTFYRGQTALGQLQSNNNNTKPVTETFSFNITPSKEDDGVQYWCEAKLELGPDGPQPPPVVMSQTITATVYYKPQLEGSSQPEPIPVMKGGPLRLDCSSVGNPDPSYAWTLPSGRPSTSNSSVLTINSATFADEGKYTCNVSNDVGSVTVKLDVKVHENYTIILIAVIVAAVVVTVILGLIGYFYCYKQGRMGQYNLKDVFSLRTLHSAVPTAE